GLRRRENPGPPRLPSQEGETGWPRGSSRKKGKNKANARRGAGKEHPTPVNRHGVLPRGRRNARTPFARNPASGSAGTSHRSCSALGISALQQIDVLEVDRLLVAIDREDDR